MSGSPDVRIDASDLERAGDALAGRSDDVLGAVAEAAIGEMAVALQASVRQAASRHRRTGELDRRIRLVDDHPAGISSSAELRVIGRVAPIIIGGSRSHVIGPRRAGALAFAGPPHGFASRVNHPGTRPDPFFARGVTQARADIDRITDASADLAADRLAELAEG